jgi:hypothetical protein
MDQTAKDLGPAMIPIYTKAELPQWHDITFDNEGSLWQINGNDSSSFAEGKPALIKYDPATGQVLETAEFIPDSCGPHGLEKLRGDTHQLRRWVPSWMAG